jgi:hypothetical protein
MIMRVELFVLAQDRRPPVCGIVARTITKTTKTITP